MGISLSSAVIGCVIAHGPGKIVQIRDISNGGSAPRLDDGHSWSTNRCIIASSESQQRELRNETSFLTRRTFIWRFGRIDTRAQPSLGSDSDRSLFGESSVQPDSREIHGRMGLNSEARGARIEARSSAIVC